jgi:hypothetical protein
MARKKFVPLTLKQALLRYTLIKNGKKHLKYMINHYYFPLPLDYIATWLTTVRFLLIFSPILLKYIYCIVILGPGLLAWSLLTFLYSNLLNGSLKHKLLDQQDMLASCKIFVNIFVFYIFFLFIMCHALPVGQTTLDQVWAWYTRPWYWREGCDCRVWWLLPANCLCTKLWWWSKKIGK